MPHLPPIWKASWRVRGQYDRNFLMGHTEKGADRANIFRFTSDRDRRAGIFDRQVRANRTFRGGSLCGHAAADCGSGGGLAGAAAEIAVVLSLTSLSRQ
jgi:hypothetical protein